MVKSWREDHLQDCVIGAQSSNGSMLRYLQVTYKSHNLRPKDLLLLETKKVNTRYGKRTFDYVGPKFWDALPVI